MKRSKSLAKSNAFHDYRAAGVTFENQQERLQLLKRYLKRWFNSTLFNYPIFIPISTPLSLFYLNKLTIFDNTITAIFPYKSSLVCITRPSGTIFIPMQFIVEDILLQDTLKTFIPSIGKASFIVCL